jgi:hypothetical protein
MKPCPYCAEDVPDQVTVCPFCKSQVESPAAAVRPAEDIGQNAGMRMLLPVGRSGWAIAAGYFGLFSFVVCPAPIALVLGLVAIRDIKRNPERHGMGRAVFGLVMGILGTIVLL